MGSSTDSRVGLRWENSDIGLPDPRERLERSDSDDDEPGRVDHGLVDISAIALNAVFSESIFEAESSSVI